MRDHPLFCQEVVDFGENRPSEGDVTIEIHAAGINPSDAKAMLGIMPSAVFPRTPGRDYAGVVEHVGEAVSKYKAGDRVFGFLLHANPNVRDGAWAERITLTEEISIARVPDCCAPSACLQFVWRGTPGATNGT